MEIERKFLVEELPEDLEKYPYIEMEQAYLCTDPVVRVRKENQEYVLTYKSRGMMVREEYNLPLNKEAFEHLLKKRDGQIISKTRYIIPEKDGRKIELDIFHGVHKGLVLAEVEFPTKEEAENYIPQKWMGTDVTFTKLYHNSYLSQIKMKDTKSHQ